MANKEYITDLKQIMAQCYYQVLVGEKRDDNLFEPQGFGSGILYFYQNQIFFITAEHVVSPANFSFKLDPEKTYVGAIPTNRMNLTDQGQPYAECIYFYIDKDDFTEQFLWDKTKQKLSVDRMDLFYTPIRQDSQIQGKTFVTQGQIDASGNSKYGNLRKILVQEKNIANIDKNTKYAIFGIVVPGLKNLRLTGSSIYHMDMSFLKEEKGNLFFEVNPLDEKLEKNYWQGLSGAAIFNQLDGGIVGIAIHYDSDLHQLEAISMRQINVILDAYIKTKQIRHQSSPQLQPTTDK